MKAFTLTVYLIAFFSCNNDIKKNLLKNTSKVKILDFSINQNNTIDTISNIDSLRIIFKTPHFKDFAVYNPDGDFYFIVYFADNNNIPHLYNYDSFQFCKKIDISIENFKANPWTFGIDSNQKVFTKKGKYEFHLSENLETDDGTPVEIRSIYLR